MTQLVFMVVPSVWLQDDVSVTCKEYFDPRGTGQEVWEDLKEDGQLNTEGGRWTMKQGEACVVLYHCSL